MKDVIKVHGFSRVRLGHRDKKGKLFIDGDSGWCGPNQVVNLGFQDYLCALLGAVGGSKQISHMALGTGTAPGVADTSLQGETKRLTCGNATVASKTMRSTQNFASGDHPSGTPALRNIGLFNTSSGGTLMCGNTFATSSWQSNQGVSCTYELRFS